MTESADVKKATESGAADLLSDDNILDSDELFDLDMPLDEPQPGDDLNQEDAVDQTITEQPDADITQDRADFADLDGAFEASMEDVLSASMDDDVPDALPDRRKSDKPVKATDPDEMPELAKDDALPDAPAEETAAPATPVAQSSTTADSLTTPAQQPDDEEDALFSRLDEADTDVDEAEFDIDLPEEISAPAGKTNISDIESDLAFLTGHASGDADSPSDKLPETAALEEHTAEAKTDQPTENPDRTTTPPNSTPVAEPQKDGANNMKLLANSMIYILGAVLALIVGGATWLASSATDRVGELERTTAPLAQENRDNGQARQQRLTMLETQAQAYEQRIAELEQQVHTMTAVLSSTASKNWQETMAEPAAEEETPAVTEPASTVVDAVTTPVVTITPPAKPEPQPEAQPKPEPKATTPAIAKGSWVVNMTSYETQKEAEREIVNFKARGIKAEYVRVQIKGKLWFRLRTTGFHSEHEALAYEKYLQDMQDIDAWRQKL